MSFVKSAASIGELRGLLATRFANIPIVAKIESLEAMDNLEAIVEVKPIGKSKSYHAF